jgi:hypothetical protein
MSPEELESQARGLQPEGDLLSPAGQEVQEGLGGQQEVGLGGDTLCPAAGPRAGAVIGVSPPQSAGAQGGRLATTRASRKESLRRLAEVQKKRRQKKEPLPPS